MQQTQKYKLNLIESSDPFLPDALNQNTQKLENALSAAIEGHRAETNARLTVLEAHKVVLGKYTGFRTSTENMTEYNREMFIDLGFRPKFGIMWGPSNATYFFIGDEVMGVPNPNDFRFVDGGFCVKGTLNYNMTFLYLFFF